MKGVYRLDLDPDLMPGLSNPYLCIYTNEFDLSEEHFEFMLEAAALAEELLYGS